MKSKYVKLLGVVLVIASMCAIFALHNRSGNQLSDSEIVELYIIEEYGEGDYDVYVQSEPGDEYIQHIIYENGNLIRGGSVRREYALGIIEK